MYYSFMSLDSVTLQTLLFLTICQTLFTYLSVSYSSHSLQFCLNGIFHYIFLFFLKIIVFCMYLNSKKAFPVYLWVEFPICLRGGHIFCLSSSREHLLPTLELGTFPIYPTAGQFPFTWTGHYIELSDVSFTWKSLFQHFLWYKSSSKAIL